MVASISPCAVYAFMAGVATPAHCQAAMAHVMQGRTGRTQMMEAMVINMYAELVDRLFIQVCLDSLASVGIKLCDHQGSDMMQNGRLLHDLHDHKHMLHA